MLRFIRAIRNKKKQPRNSDGMTLTENSIIALRRAFAAASKQITFYNLSIDAKALEYIAKFQLDLSPVLSTGVDNLKSSCAEGVFFSIVLF